MKKIRCSQMNHWYIFIWLVAYKDSWLFFSEGGWQSYTHTLLTSGILLWKYKPALSSTLTPNPIKKSIRSCSDTLYFCFYFYHLNYFLLFPFQPISLHRWNHGTKFYRLLFVMQTFFCIITVFIIIISLGLL